MSDTYWKYLSVIIISSVKFIGGPLAGIAEGLSILETAFLTALGSFLMVAFITFVGDTYRKVIVSYLHSFKVSFYLLLFNIVKSLGFLDQEKIISFKTWIDKKKTRSIFSKHIRTSVKIYRKFGILGIAVLTPIVFSPPIGAVIAISFNIAPKKILLNMALALMFFSFPITFIVAFLKQWSGFNL